MRIFAPRLESAAFCCADAVTDLFPDTLTDLVGRRLTRPAQVAIHLELHELIGLVRAGKVAPIPLERHPLECAHQTLLEIREGKVRGRAVLCS